MPVYFNLAITSLMLILLRKITPLYTDAISFDINIQLFYYN